MYSSVGYRTNWHSGQKQEPLGAGRTANKNVTIITSGHVDNTYHRKNDVGWPAGGQEVAQEYRCGFSVAQIGSITGLI
jgi:hypothetical protein